VKGHDLVLELTGFLRSLGLVLRGDCKLVLGRPRLISHFAANHFLGLAAYGKPGTHPTGVAIMRINAAACRPFFDTRTQVLRVGLIDQHVFLPHLRLRYQHRPVLDMLGRPAPRAQSRTAHFGLTTHAALSNGQARVDMCLACRFLPGLAGQTFAQNKFSFQHSQGQYRACDDLFQDCGT